MELLPPQKSREYCTRQQIQTNQKSEMFQSDLLNLEGEGSGPAVLGSFSVGVEGGGGLDGLGMGLEERVAAGMGRMAERMAELEARVEELEAQLSVKGATVVAAVSTPVKTAVKTEKTAPPAPVKTAAKKEKTAAAVPVMAPLDAPTPASYRLDASVVSAHCATKCQARRLKPSGEDKRFSPSVFKESLCTGEVEADGLCSTCNRWKDDPKKWNGLITEEPLATTHMLGTAWAAKCKWTASGSAPASSAASVASVEESVQTPAPVSAATVAPMDAAAAAQAKKEAAAAKRKATLAKKKEAAAASTAAVAVVTETAVTVAAAASTTEPVADAGELRMLQGEFYWVVGSNAYEYDQIEEKPGDFVGRVRADETIDGDAEEEGAVESDGE
jgi:hypothetical protein